MKKAFTLIELLVVISIIALLMAILMPVLSAAKKQAQATVCLSNVHSLSQAWYLYALDNDGLIVGGHTASERNPYYSWVLVPQDITGNVTGSSSTVEEKLIGIHRGLLWSYVKVEEVYHCPGDTRYKKPPVLTQSGDGGYRSYSIAGGMNGLLDSWTAGWAAIIQHKKLGNIKSPASKYVFVEEMEGRGYNVNAWVINPTGDQWVDPIAIWHINSSILGFADGHSERHKWVDPDTIEMGRKQIIFFTDPGSEDIKYMQRGYGHKGLRQ